MNAELGLRKTQALFDVASRVRCLCRDGRVQLSYSREAVGAKSEANLTDADVIAILRACAITDCEMRGSLWFHVAQGNTADGEPIALDVTIDERRGKIRVANIFQPNQALNRGECPERGS